MDWVQNVLAKLGIIQTSSANAASDADIAESHWHNYEQCFGAAAVPTATHFADLEGLTPFLITSGNNAFGVATNIIGSVDTPVRAGSTYFDPREWSIQDVSNANQYILRVIWGTPGQTSAQAEAAGQWSEVYAQQLTANGNNKPQDVRSIRLAVGSQVWAKIKNGTNLATMHVLVTAHEYPSPSQ